MTDKTKRTFYVEATKTIQYEAYIDAASEEEAQEILDGMITDDFDEVTAKWDIGELEEAFEVKRDEHGNIVQIGGAA